MYAAMLPCCEEEAQFEFQSQHTYSAKNIKYGLMGKVGIRM